MTPGKSRPPQINELLIFDYRNDTPKKKDLTALGLATNSGPSLSLICTLPEHVETIRPICRFLNRCFS